jgi:FAD/FMN-containing dehydrogenase
MSEDKTPHSDLDSEQSQDSAVTDAQMTRRKFIASTAAATGTLMLGAHGVLANGNGAKMTYDWAKLGSTLKGDVVTASSPNWAEVLSQMVWNDIKPDRAPDVIVRVKVIDDVIAAVNFARENGLKIAVHGGGHTWCGLAVRNGGMTIDLTALNKCEIDVAAKTAVLEPVLSNREVLKLLGAKGLSFPVGHCPTVKMSGYLLNGGLSWNLADWGLGVHSVEAYELVTADGKLVKASATEHEDLYWAARGCGPGMFAVAVRYHLKCFDLPKAIMTSNYWYHFDDLKEVVEKVTDIAWKMPKIVELSIFMSAAPPDVIDKFKSTNGMCFMVSAVAFANSEDEGKAALMPLENDPTSKKSVKKAVCVASNFEALEDASGAAWPEHTRNLVENSYSNGKPVDMYMALKDLIIRCPSSKSVIVFVLSTGGKNILPKTSDISCSANGHYYGGCWSIWEHAKDDDANKAWQVEVQHAMRKHIDGLYIGETDYVEERGNIKFSYTAEKFKKLANIRAKYDPNGLFQGFAGGLPPAKTT